AGRSKLDRPFGESMRPRERLFRAPRARRIFRAFLGSRRSGGRATSSAALRFVSGHYAAAVAVVAGGVPTGNRRAVERAALAEIRPAVGCNASRQVAESEEHALGPFARPLRRRKLVHDAALGRSAFLGGAVQMSVGAENWTH